MHTSQLVSRSAYGLIHATFGFISSVYDHNYAITGVRSGRIALIIGFKIASHTHNAILPKWNR
jgi:hypothetical protein